MIANKNPKLDAQLGKMWRASQERIVQKQAGQTSLGYLDLTKLGIETDALKLVPEERARTLKIATFEFRNQVVALAAADPSSQGTVELIEELKKKGLTARVFLVSTASLEYAWSYYQYVPKVAAKEISSRVDIEASRVASLEKELVSLGSVAAALQKLFNKDMSAGSILEVVLAGALTNRASDIHFEPRESRVRLRYRIDGVLSDVADMLSVSTYHLLISRIKLLANLRLNITTISQDGRFTIGLGSINIEIRVSIIPSEFGETIVMRILDPRAIQVNLENLGLRADDLKIVEDQLRAPNGMILNTGPTGSGKTTTLYAFLQKVALAETKVITIEDPIEYHLKGIEQTQVDSKAGYTFSNGLQAIMRQDPDVILVGEIRDKDTAAIAIQAALTGHLVFSTLHTNSATGVVPRLLDLEAPITSIGPALNLIIAQRLVRKLCEKCKTEQVISSELKKELEVFITHLPPRVDKSRVEVVKLSSANKNGCEACHSTGYRGRIGIFELLPVENEMESLIRAHAGEAEIASFASKQGMVTLQQDGILKALTGVTDLSEIEGVTGPLPFKY